jgi:hypothetical protein
LPQLEQLRRSLVHGRSSGIWNCIDCNSRRNVPLMRTVTLFDPSSCF